MRPGCTPSLGYSRAADAHVMACGNALTAALAEGAVPLVAEVGARQREEAVLHEGLDLRLAEQRLRWRLPIIGRAVDRLR